MKTCPKCQASIEDDAKFCKNCGTKIENESNGRTCPQCGAQAPNEAKFCPSCGFELPNQEEETTEVVVKKECPIDRRKITIRGCLCGYVEPGEDYEYAGNQIGDYVFYQDRLYFTTENTSFFLKLQTFGQNSKFTINYRDIIAISISRVNSRDYALYVYKNDNWVYVIGGNGLTSSSNNDQICKIGYMLELYRRLFWMYDELYDGKSEYPMLGITGNEVVDLHSITTEDLIKKYNQL